MGCAVNGPGEASHADIGVACGIGQGVIFRKGEIIRTVTESEIEDVLYDEERKLTFYRTHIRLEKEKDLEVLREKVVGFQGACQFIFTHECYLEQKEMLDKIELCAEAYAAG